MNDRPDEPEDEQAEAEALATAEDAYRARVTDSVLSELVGICDDSDFSMAVSVQAGGYLISGVLISVRDYFRGLAELVRGAEVGGSEALDAVAGLFENLGEQQQVRRERRMAFIQSDQDETSELQPDDRVRPAYLHLRDARVIGPAGELAVIPFWRGRLDHVDAFWLGSLSVRPVSA